ncbi:MAG: bile acid:sodium symporter family protein [Candidatus Marinimicrobia bacterium]|jgi:bile acid:Na+ symporter, BASS family|nr:bile acid:sodium symporter family protein [Candidatus Neomarinimicrobiota bacterium]MBT3839769.1 bile acid:sodium symporter family protein [Candidatus Neomarinimicrobiota bacterium]MBT3999534.1 bile acid:sodium symporter family protein [Candidatus Neomarinimicrobiota bacterium]MBT4283411.1 bile acid:sodium symporter family protein [Candidatus Neomarinimicrobiota bacterium]MBT4578946.1 bile acid:sodium symporter family protein [Candidatus Neomarinimicrobiota bacterium]
MTTQFISTLLLPGLLFLIMLGMGMTLSFNDFKRVGTDPKGIFVGLGSQLIVLPMIAFLLAIVMNLPTYLAIGLMIIAASPGGATSNLYSHLSKGDTALSISLTAFSSMITIFTIPFIVNYSLSYFGIPGKEMHLPIMKTIYNIFKLTALPTFIGMLIHLKYPVFSKKIEFVLKWLSGGFILLALWGMLTLLGKQGPVLNYILSAGPSVIILNVITLGAGFGIATLFKLDIKRRATISIETGIQNGVMGMTIAASPALLGNAEFAVSSGVYGLVMCFTGIFIIYFGNKYSMN